MSETVGEPVQKCNHIGCDTFLYREEYCNVQTEALRSDIFEVTSRLDAILWREIGKPVRVRDKPHSLVTEGYFLIEEVRAPQLSVNHALRVEVFYEKNTRTKERSYRITTQYECIPMRGHGSLPSRLPVASFPLNEYSIEYDGGLVYASVNEPKVDESVFDPPRTGGDLKQVFDSSTLHARAFTLYDAHLLGRLLDGVDEVPGS